MAQVKLKEEQELWKPAEVDHSEVRELKEELGSRDVQSLEDTSSVLHYMKEEAEEVEIKAETQFLHVTVKSEVGEPQSSVLHQTETEENREDTDAAGTGSQKLPESEQHCENSSDTDDSEDWAPSAERPTPQTQSELSEQLHGSDHRNNVSEGTQAKRRICSYCRKWFPTITKLIIHERSHTGERPFICTVCEKSYISKYNLEVHMRTHAEEKPFKCTVCTKCFSYNFSLKSHMRTHSGERPFKCSVCAKAFTREDSLKTHARTHTGDRPFRCSICAKGFTCKRHLKQHMISHSENKPFKCTVCAKDFRREDSLKTHVRTHTGEKFFECTVCAKVFAQKGNLKSHMRTHTGEKPFKCTVCKKDFTYGSSLTNHMRTCHSLAGSQKLPENEQHSENSSDTDDSADWAPSAERPTPQTQSELREQLHDPAHRNSP